MKEVLLGLGAIISAYDNALFLWHDDNGELFGMLVSHVDDFAFCGNPRFQTEVIEQLKSIFKVGLYANGSFKYVGLLIQSDTGILVNQELYVLTVKEIELKQNRGYKKADELNKEEKAECPNDVGNKSNTPRFKLRNMCHEQCWKAPNSEDNP